MSVRTGRRRALVLRTIHTYKDRCKALPGGTWDGAAKAWSYPLTPGMAWRLKAEFEGVEQRHSVGFKALLKEAQLSLEAAQLAQEGLLPADHIHKTVIKPWKHQLRAFWFCYPLRAAMLALKMGEGKTKVVCDLVLNRNHRFNLIVAPLSAVDTTWPAELAKHMPPHSYEALILDSGTVSKRTQRAAEFMANVNMPAHRFVVINHEAVWREPFATWAIEHAWDLAVVDESHRIKAAGGKESRWLYRFGMQAAYYRLCLTGTPMAHSPLDVYGQYRFLEPAIFGTRKGEFDARYAIFDEWFPSKVNGYQNEEELNRKFYSIAFRVEKDVLDLPPEHDITRKVKMEVGPRKIYDRLDEDFEAELVDGRITTNNALTKLLRLQQLTGGWAMMDPVGLPEGKKQKPIPKRVSHAKAWLLEEVLKDLDHDEPVVVFCRFHHDLDAVKKAAESLKRPALELSGRVKELKRWQEGEASILAVQIQSGAESIDLTRCHYAIYYSLGYSLKDYLQSRKRVHRPGQKHPTTFIHLAVKDTKDETVLWAIGKRLEVVTAIMSRQGQSRKLTPA